MRTTPRIVIVGGGFGGVEVAKRVSYLAERGHAWVTIINATEHFLFTPLLHEVAAGSLSAASVVEPLREIFRDDAVTVRDARVSEIDSAQKLVKTNNGDVPYDYLVVSTGSTTNHFGVPGAQEHTLSLKDLDDARRIRDRVLDLYDRAARSKEGDVRGRTVSIVIVGGGPTGVELSAELVVLCNRTLRRYYGKDVTATVTLIASDPELLVRYQKPARKEAFRVLKKTGVDIRLATKVVEVRNGSVSIEPIPMQGEPVVCQQLEADMVVWAAGVKRASVPCGDAVELERDGRIKVTPALQSTLDASIFVLGDAAAGTPMLAQVAVQQGAVVAKNITRLVEADRSAAVRTGKGKDAHSAPELLDFTFESKGQLVSLGRFKAAGEAYGIVVTGILAWFMWRTVYLFKFHSWRKRFRIMFEWTIELFSPRDITR
jgi:NADH dehydrogenase